MSGPPPLIPYGRHDIDDSDVAEVVRVLRSDWLTTGPDVAAFEEELAARVGAKHAIVVNNATSALHLAMRVAGIGTGDRVLTSANTFLASANCAAYVGATPDFADIDPRTYNVSPDSLQHAWKDDVRAVVAVDFAGQPCELPAISKLARERNAVLIDDASHAIGATLDHEGSRYSIGANPWADMTVFSFHPVKTLTTGEGGALLTDNDDYADHARRLRSHGIVREQAQFLGLGAGMDEFGPWYYEMHDLGYNYRITDIQCALGRSQLRRLSRFVARRSEIVKCYNEAFCDIQSVTTPDAEGRAQPSWHLYVLQIDFECIGKTRTEVMLQLRTHGIGSQVHYIPVHLQPYYRQTYGYAPGKCRIAEEYYTRCLSLPLFSGMSDDDVKAVIKAVKVTLR